MCWGNDFAEQPGATTERRARPEPVPALKEVVELDLGPFAGCARLASGRLVCWRQDTSSLGSLAASPKTALTSNTVAVGLSYTCVVRSGQVFCHGDLVPFGAFGAAVARIPGIARAVQIGAGGGFGCAIETGGSVACWGQGFNLNKGTIRAVPVASISNATSLALSSWNGCVIQRGGEVTCWTPSRTNKPFTIENVLAARKIAIDQQDGCAVHSNGAVSCWSGDTDAVPRAERVPGIADAIDVAVGTGFRCALLGGGRVRCWGYNGARELGIETLVRSDTPVDVCALDRVTQLATGGQHVCALRDSGAVYCWGANHDGQLDGGTVPDATHASVGGSSSPHHAVPRRVPLSTSIVQVVAHDQTTCTLDPSGQVACWGRNPFASMQVGPQAFALPSEPVTSIALGSLGLCGLTRSGFVICNGARVAGVEHATRLRVDKLACADVAGPGKRRLVCWGPGWIVPGPVERHQVQRALDPTTLVEPVSCGDEVCGRAAGRLVCRDATTFPIASRCKPWDPDRLDDIFASRSDPRTTCVLRANGLVACSGDNGFGQLGTGQLGYLQNPAD